MIICIFGSEEDRKELLDALSQAPMYTGCKMETDLFSDYDEFLYQSAKREYDAVFVTANGAEGMEGVIAAKNIFPQTPVIWLSNDNGFGPQSYRLGVSYFHTKPITAKVLTNTLEKHLILKHA